MLDSNTVLQKQRSKLGSRRRFFALRKKGVHGTIVVRKCLQRHINSFRWLSLPYSLFWLSITLDRTNMSRCGPPHHVAPVVSPILRHSHAMAQLVVSYRKGVLPSIGLSEAV